MSGLHQGSSEEAPILPNFILSQISAVWEEEEISGLVVERAKLQPKYRFNNGLHSNSIDLEQVQPVQTYLFMVQV